MRIFSSLLIALAFMSSAFASNVAPDLTKVDLAICNYTEIDFSKNEATHGFGSSQKTVKLRNVVKDDFLNFIIFSEEGSDSIFVLYTAEVRGGHEVRLHFGVEDDAFSKCSVYDL